MRSTVSLLLSRTGLQRQPYSRVAIPSASIVLLSRTALQRQPYFQLDLHSASFVRFYTSHNPNFSEESGIWHVLKTYSGIHKLVNATLVLTKQAVRITVPEAEAYVIERDGKYFKTLTPGTHYVSSTMDKVAYVHSLKEEAIHFSDQNAITRDNVLISINGSLCFKIVDPKLASYAIHDPMNSLIQLALTFVGGEICRMTIDQISRERDTLIEKILMRINDVARDWGLACLRCEIRDISLPPELKKAFDKLATAKREAMDARAPWGTNVTNADSQWTSTMYASQVNARNQAMMDYAYDSVARACEVARKV